MSVSGNLLTSENEEPDEMHTKRTSLVVLLVPRPSLANHRRRGALAQIDRLFRREAEERPEGLHDSTQLRIGNFVGLVGGPLAQLGEKVHCLIPAAIETDISDKGKDEKMYRRVCPPPLAPSYVCCPTSPRHSTLEQVIATHNDERDM